MPDILDTFRDWISEHPDPVVHRKDAPLEDPFSKYARENGFKPVIDVDQRLKDMEYKGGGDRGVHATQIAVGASLLARGWDPEDITERLMEETERVAGPNWNMDRERRAIEKSIRTAIKKGIGPRPGSKPTLTASSQEARPGPLKGQPKANGSSPLDHDTRDDDDGAEVVDLNAVRQQKAAAKITAKDYHLMLAQALIDTLKKRNEKLIYIEGGAAYWYRKGLWDRLTTSSEYDRLSKEIRIGCKTLKITAKKNLVSETQAELRGILQADDEIPWDTHGKIVIISDNGGHVIDPNDLSKIEPLTPEHYATFGIKVDYDKKAKCPRWLRLLKECLPDQETVDIVQELVGAALLARKPQTMTKATVFWGPSDSGKSNILDVITGLLTDDPIAVEFDAFEGRHGTVPFLRHAPWVLHEAFQQGKWPFSATTKALLGHNLIHVDNKGGKLESHTFRGPVFWGTNWSPQFKEQSKAIENRLLVIKLHKVFSRTKPVGLALEADANKFNSIAEHVLATERPGLLNWAISGLQRLRARGFFVKTQEMEETIGEMRRDGNICAGMVEDLVEFDANSMVSSGNFNAALEVWWDDTKGEETKKPSPDSVGRALKMLDERIAIDNKELRYNGNRYYVGLKLNDEGLAAWKRYSSGASIYGKSRHDICQKVDEVNREIPPEWNEKALVKRMRKMSGYRSGYFSGKKPVQAKS
jgi:phage/plasmid-associated DNA primase